MTPRWPFLPGYAEVGFTTRLWGSPLTPAAVFSEFSLFKKTKNKKKETHSHSSLHLSLHLSVHRRHQEQWLILLRQCSITGPVAWQCSRPQISTTCTALKSKESGLAVRLHSWGRHTEKKYKQRRRRGEKLGWRSVKTRGRKQTSVM